MKKQAIILLSVLYALTFTSSRGGVDNRLYDGGDLPVITIIERAQIPKDKIDEYRLLCRLVYSEAGHEPFEGKKAVAHVVLNIARYKGLSVKETVYLPGIFNGVQHYTFKLEPNAESKEAVRLVMAGLSEFPDGVLFFYNPVASTDTKWIKHISRYSYKKIGHHMFCYHPKFYPS